MLQKGGSAVFNKGQEMFIFDKPNFITVQKKTSLPKKKSFLSPDYIWRELASVLAVGATTFLLYNVFFRDAGKEDILKQQYQQHKLDSIVQINQTYLIRRRLDSTKNHKANTSKNLNDELKFEQLEAEIYKLNQSTIGLRQAINPFKPDEVLTIARLKDEVNKIRDQVNGLTSQNATRQQIFEDSVKRELDSADKNTYLVLAVLIPLVLNFLYTVWKDNKKRKDPVSTENAE
ncbi:hypothetical protein [Mucilaginibacter sp. OK098]|uniref:hypothetical protein n=1 Tax=Mucilaginibacter sp. OK098 TaxID=1855297 RepID=UPI0009175E7F|nr:hypothetical protein [Mucilaginibacter sp. OK098]SHN27242.1 hypothetical protein SAMN05216524_1087 [Mucilaginibacter sp. OK098]